MLRTFAPARPFARSDMSLLADTSSGRVTYTTAPSFPILQLGARYKYALLNGSYALQTYSQENLYLNGQYSLALLVGLVYNESLELSDSISNSAERLMTMTQALTLDDNADVSREVALAMLQAFTLGDTYVSAAVINISIAESIQLGDTFLVPGSDFTVYVMNTNSNALSTYKGWDFNSMAKIGGRYYGASQDGLFLLEGDTDNGTAIDASILTVSTDFGTQQQKQMSYAMLGLSQTGDMYLRVVHEDNPTYTYKLTTSDQTMRNARVVIGKGMSTRYWQFELLNENGADFELESVTFYPVVMTRRITER